MLKLFKPSKPKKIPVRILTGLQALTWKSNHYHEVTPPKGYEILLDESDEY